MSVIAAIASLLAVVLQSSELRLAISLKACASYSSSSSKTCVYNHFGFDCYGDDEYYKEARDCLSKYEYTRGAQNQDCSCVVSHSSENCFNYSKMKYCEHFLDKIPSITIISFTAACLCLVSCCFMVYFVSLALRNLGSAATASYSVVRSRLSDLQEDEFEDDEEQVELTSPRKTGSGSSNNNNSSRIK